VNIEHAYLGQVLLDNRVLWRYDRISQAELSAGDTRQVLDAIEGVIKRGHRADLVSVAGWLREHGRPDLTSEIAGWTSLDAAPLSLVLEIKKAALRRGLDYAVRIAVENLGKGADPEAVQQELEESLSEISTGSAGLKRPSQVSGQLEAEAISAFEGQPIPGIKTGLRNLDKKIGKLRPGSVTIVAARTSVGKTSLALTMAAHSLRSGVPVGLISLEETVETITRRLASMQSGVSAVAIEEGMTDRAGLTAWTGGLSTVGAWPLHVADAGNSIGYMHASARRMVRAERCGLIIVDYVQLLEGSSRNQSDYSRVSEASRAVKTIAKELNVPVIAVAQLNRAAADKEPKLSDLRDSGQLEQDADAILLLWRRLSGPQVEGQDPEYEHLLIVGKHRTRKPGPVPVRFNAACFQWEDRDV
jgi:replicative DNA helicase